MNQSIVSELRRDPIFGRWVIVAENRSQRPFDFVPSVNSSSKESCPFCEGNEQDTPHEIYSVRKKDSSQDTPGWQIRVVPNKYPALHEDGKAINKGDDFFQICDGYGSHEVIIESSEHLTSLTQLSENQITEIFTVYRQRLLDLSRNPGLRYGLLFKNAGVAAGASLEHLHSQLISTPFIPEEIQAEIQGSQQYFRSRGACVWCDMISRELDEKCRIICETESMIAFCPFASRLPFEIWILPKEHESHYQKSANHVLNELGSLIRLLLLRLEKSLKQPSYNYLINTAPFDTTENEHYHWHIEVFPRLTKTAGFEWGTGYFINPVSPESAAKILRDASQ